MKTPVSCESKSPWRAAACSSRGKKAGIAAIYQNHFLSALQNDRVKNLRWSVSVSTYFQNKNIHLVNSFFVCPFIHLPGDLSLAAAVLQSILSSRFGARHQCRDRCRRENIHGTKGNF